MERLSDMLDWYERWQTTSSAQGLASTSGRVGFLAIDSLPEPPLLNRKEIFEVGEARIVGRLDQLVSEELDEESASEKHLEPDSAYDYVPEQIHKQADRKTNRRADKHADRRTDR